MKTTIALCLFWSLNCVATPTIDRVIVVVLENTTYSKAIQQKYLKQLSSMGARLDNYSAIGHPSEPNYIALISGSTNGVTGDGNYNLSAPNLADLLESHHLTWATYAEGFPGNCFLGGSRGKYARKHNPFISFISIQKSPSRCANIKGTDADVGHLPSFSLYIPDLNNDGHDTGVGFADKWLKSKFDKYLQDPKFMAGTLFIVTFDEGTSNNQVLTILVGPAIRAGSTSTVKMNHYNLLRTIEDIFKVGNLGRNDAAAAPIGGVWN